MPVIVVAGEEEFEVSRRVADYKAKLLDPQWAQFNFSRLENCDLTEIIDAAATLPFGMGNKVILIDRCELFTKKRGKDKDSKKEEASASSKDKQLEQLAAALKNVAANTYIIFSCPYNFDSTLKTSKAVKPVCTLEEYPKEKYYTGSENPKLSTWCNKEAKRFGATIDDAAIYYLLDSFEADLRSVSAEIQKAAVSILPATHITQATVVALSPHHSHVFTLAEEWITGKTGQALVSCQEILSRQSGMPVIALLQTFLSKWIHMRALVDSINSSLPGGPGVSRRELPMSDMAKRIATELGQRSTFIVERDLRNIAKHSLDSLVAKRERLTQIEYLVKTGQMPESQALESFIAS